MTSVSAAETQQDNDGTNLGSSDLLAILRGGSAALSAKWSETDDDAADAAAKFQKATIEEILERSIRLQHRAEAKIEKEVGVQVGDAKLNLAEQAEEEERALLRGIERVETRSVLVSCATNLLLADLRGATDYSKAKRYLGKFRATPISVQNGKQPNIVSESSA